MAIAECPDIRGVVALAAYRVFQVYQVFQVTTLALLAIADLVATAVLAVTILAHRVTAAKVDIAASVVIQVAV